MNEIDLKYDSKYLEHAKKEYDEFGKFYVEDSNLISLLRAFERIYGYKFVIEVYYDGFFIKKFEN